MISLKRVFCKHGNRGPPHALAEADARPFSRGLALCFRALGFLDRFLVALGGFGDVLGVFAGTLGISGFLELMSRLGRERCGLPSGFGDRCLGYPPMIT